MKLDLQDITFMIVTYKAKKVIFNCINSLPKLSNIIVIENSGDKELMKELESKYDNIEVVLNENIGMGASNNIGIKKTKSKYAFVINPDVYFKKNTFSKLVDSIKHIHDFSIISPINENKLFPNYRIKKNYSHINENIIEVDSIDGYSMLINKHKFENDNYFDENFFLYLENTDLCLRQKNKKGKLYIIKNSEIQHIGSYSTKLDDSNTLEYLRNWHWMWSKFYFNKKHYGYFTALLKTSKNLSSSLIKYLFYFIIFNKHKKTIYKMRLVGLVNSMLGKKAYLRPLN